MHLLTSAFLALAISAGPVRIADPLDDDPLPSLTLPDGPTIPMPPGSRVFGPNGIKPDAMPTTPSDPDGGAAANDVAPPAPPAPEPHLSAAQRRQARIDDLLHRLAEAKDETEALALSTMVDRLWLQSGSPTADLLMSRAVTAITGSDLKLAETLLDKIVALQPGWVEAWNKRATVRYLDNDDMGSMQDIGHVLAIEPRHFGALSGMGFILHRNGQDKAALTVLRKAAQINPQNQDVKSLIDKLTPDVEGHEL